MSRRGFSLMEVVVALAITSLVIALAYSAWHAGTALGERVHREQNALLDESVLRDLLVAALRHAVSGATGRQEVFVVGEDSVAGSHLLRFATTGLARGGGAGGRWWVTLRGSSDGLVFEAIPTGGGPVLRVHYSAARGFRLYSLGHDPRIGWREGWAARDRAPAAVLLQFLGGSTQPVAPLTVRVGLEGGLP
jgi:prepilin-type N-terminal cleavage/methylation domain-containing protein